MKTQLYTCNLFIGKCCIWICDNDIIKRGTNTPLKTLLIILLKLEAETTSKTPTAILLKAYVNLGSFKECHF